MKTLDELYQQMLRQAADGRPIDVDGDPKLIDCLAHPDDHPLIWRVKPCVCPPDEKHPCEEACSWGAIKPSPDGKGLVINDAECVGCQACVDACQKQQPLPNSQLSDNLAKPDWHHHHDYFLDSNPRVNWNETLVHAEEIGLGTRQYELVVVK